HPRLGFARLSDYTRERLGLSARQVQDLARVAERLESLPAIAAAFAAGDLSWTQTRLLATAATADSEREWLALARDGTVRALEALVVRLPPDPDERHRLRFSVRCPRRVRARWRQAVELARRMAGSELTLAQAAEVIAAEGLSAAPAPVDDRMPALTAAYREGALSWLRALTVLPVATADDAWVARAGEVTLRRLVAEVEWALDRRDAGLPPAPPSPDATLAPVEWQMPARADEALDADITFTAAPSVVAL